MHVRMSVLVCMRNCERESLTTDQHFRERRHLFAFGINVLCNTASFYFFFFFFFYKAFLFSEKIPLCDAGSYGDNDVQKKSMKINI